MKRVKTYMTELFGGYNNQVLRVNDSVIKVFEDDGRVKRPAKDRQKAEIWALEEFEFSPEYIGTKGNQVFMEYVDGERNVGGLIERMPFAMQEAVFLEFGKVLKNIHDTKIDMVFGTVEPQKIQKASLGFLSELVEKLKGAKIDTYKLDRYLGGGLKEEVVQEKGATLVHGDYWLNNVVGKVQNGNFTITSILDWELARIASPYEDYALIELSSERVYENAGLIWNGYGEKPDRETIHWFGVKKCLEWMAGEEDLDLSSPFYQDKLSFIEEVVYEK